MTHPTRTRAARRAFSLIELLIVIAILLVLGGIVAVNFLGTKEKADVDLQRAQFDSIDGALKLFKLHMKRYPTTDEGLAALWDKTVLETEEDEAAWQGAYLEEKIDKDAWGSELVYTSPAELVEGAPYDLVSLGPDKEEGTEDDITNHATNADGEIEAEGDFTIEE